MVGIFMVARLRRQGPRLSLRQPPRSIGAKALQGASRSHIQYARASISPGGTGSGSLDASATTRRARPASPRQACVMAGSALSSGRNPRLSPRLTREGNQTRAAAALRVARAESLHVSTRARTRTRTRTKRPWQPAMARMIRDRSTGIRGLRDPMHREEKSAMAPRQSWVELGGMGGEELHNSWGRGSPGDPRRRRVYLYADDGRWCFAVF